MVLSVVACTAAPQTAAADEARAHDVKLACADAYTEAQTLRDSHRLRAARERLRVCAQPECSAFIHKDCTAWLAEVEARVPSVVLSARDAEGRPLVDVAVSVDGASLASALDGRAIDVDPGPHTFTFAATGGGEASLHVVVLEGQKAQSVSVPVPVPGVPVAPPTVPRAGGDGSVSQPFWSAQRALGLTAGGVGVVGLVLGGVFGAMTLSETSSQKSDCASPAVCPNHAAALADHASASADGTISTTAFVAGGAMVAVGALLFVLGGRDDAPASGQARLTVRPSVGPASVGVRGEF
jgi:hypothetical protein